jgi:hypothetical protein
MLAVLLSADHGFCIALCLLPLRSVKKSHRQHRQRFRPPSFFPAILEKNIQTLFPILDMF